MHSNKIQVNIARDCRFCVYVVAHAAVWCGVVWYTVNTVDCSLIFPACMLVKMRQLYEYSSYVASYMSITNNSKLS